MADNNNGNSNNSSQEDANQAQDPSRRRFVKNTGMVIGGVAGGSLLGGLFTNQFISEDEEASGKDKKSNKGPDEARMFFTSFDDFAALEQATERIYPEDDNGPGAIELGVPIFIDKQLAGDWGSNKRDYMKGPAQDVDDDIDTYQTLLDRGEVFVEGLKKLNKESQKRHDKKFFDAEEEQQEELLKEMQEGKLELDGVKAITFFRLLRQMTLEGAYSDPLYGGNRGMQGWKMKEYPGVRAGYKDLVDSDEFQKFEPTSLKDYQRQ